MHSPNMHKHVRGDESNWALADVAKSILDDLFPPNITELLREKFNRAQQGNHSLKDWHRYLTKLASRVAHVSKAEIRRRFWYGSAQYLRVKWSEEGMGPEYTDTTVDGMLEAGLIHERTHQWQTAEANRAKGRSGKNDNRTGNQSRNGSSSHKPREGDGQRSHHSGDRKQGKPKGHQQRAGGEGGQSGYKNGKRRHKLTPEQEKEYRAEGKCFNCGDKSHDYRNCPKRLEAVPSRNQKGKKSVYTGAVEVGTLGFLLEPSVEINMITLAPNTYRWNCRRLERHLNGRSIYHNVERDSLYSPVTIFSLSKTLGAAVVHC